MKSLSLTTPHALIMVGIPGSGKTAFAEKFSHTFNAPRIDIDQLLAYAKDPASADALLLLQLEEVMRTNASIVIEADASSRVRRTELAKVIKDGGYTPLFIWVQTDTETARQRSIKINKVDPATFETAIKRFSSPHESEAPLVISGKHTYASQAKIVLKRLSAPREAATKQQPPARSGRITIQ